MVKVRWLEFDYYYSRFVLFKILVGYRVPIYMISHVDHIVLIISLWTWLWDTQVTIFFISNFVRKSPYPPWDEPSLCPFLFLFWRKKCPFLAWWSEFVHQIQTRGRTPPPLLPSPKQKTTHPSPRTHTWVCECLHDTCCLELLKVLHSGCLSILRHELKHGLAGQLLFRNDLNPFLEVTVNYGICIG